MVSYFYTVYQNTVTNRFTITFRNMCTNILANILLDRVCSTGAVLIVRFFVVRRQRNGSS